MSFTWKHASAYEFVKRKGHPGPPAFGCVVRVIAPVGPEDREYSPLADTPELFREFALLSQSGYLAFAAKYGLLGLASLDPNTRVEYADQWDDEIRPLFEVVASWDVLHGDASAEIENVVLYKVKGSARSRRQLLGQKIVGGINAARLRHSLLPRLEIASAETLEFMETYEPTTLIGAIWTQAIHAVLRRTEHFPCAREGCGEWIERSPSKRGPKARFCSDVCRALHDQRQKTLAREMLREKASITAVCKATQLSPGRVKEIARAKGRR